MFCRTWAARQAMSPRTVEAPRPRTSRRSRKEARRRTLPVPLQRRRTRLCPARTRQPSRPDPDRQARPRGARPRERAGRQTRLLRASPPAVRGTTTAKLHPAPRIRTPAQGTGPVPRNPRRKPIKRTALTQRRPRSRPRPLWPGSFLSRLRLRRHRLTPHQPTQIPPASRRWDRTERPQQPPRP